MPRLSIALAVLVSACAWAQPVVSIRLEQGRISEVKTSANAWQLARPLLEFELNGKPYSTTDKLPIQLDFTSVEYSDRGSMLKVTFRNPSSRDTFMLSNVLPLGRVDTEAYITGLGNHWLSRTHLFLPEKSPVNIIVPDNAWNLGYSAIVLDHQHRLFGLARRDPDSFVKATRKRFETILLPGGSVAYWLYFDRYEGDWRAGLKVVFQQRYLYDLTTFDDKLFQRPDLQWIKKAYVMHLMMAWDKDYYDFKTGKFNWSAFQHKGKQLYGGDDVICLWPTWPTLGLDQRNQFDMYRDLPGGLLRLRQLADSLRMNGTKFFIAYNPWDESTRSEGHLAGLVELIRETSADGLVLDTKGESSRELQEAADAVKPGVIMYSEGMAVPKDMPGIISGRVHNALYYPPMLNLNKFIRPDFAIFRVAEVFKEPIRREYAVAFFNGYGTEINQFAPGHPEWEEEQYRFLGRTTRILRENHTNFISPEWQPLLPTTRDSIWVNTWPIQEKTIYTIYSLKSEGYHGPLFTVQADDNFHLVDIWNHEQLSPSVDGNQWMVPVRIDGFHSADLGTNNEGAVSCVARLRKQITADILQNRLQINCSAGTEIRIWTGIPSYDKNYHSLRTGQHDLFLPDIIGRYEGKIVVQAFDSDELIDEVVLTIKPGTPRLISRTEKTKPASKVPDGMLKIPAGKFSVKFTQGDEFIPYPKELEGKKLDMPSFWMDKHPVTNARFEQFLQATNYLPKDTANFLKHWRNGKPLPGEEQFPVIYVSYEDALAFAAWAGKRLPTEVEWQYAAQTEMLNEWPWKQVKPVTRKEQYVTETLTVKAIEGINPAVANLGDGNLYPVGKYKKGSNPNGLTDLSGCVWQLTNDVYESGSYRYIIMKGGSYFKPSSSWWYVQGGPRELHYRQALLRVSPGFERNATVGFRCVMDQ
ncbi:MAG: formylglycine-generating enzyme family protein [Cyclobacteriaceae bacterium]|nr:formylglycine-generating enzyme family protein [Cyclobacteriaceae bacterium]